MMSKIAKKSIALLSLVLLSSSLAQPLQEKHQGREQRQLKTGAAAAAEADVKMLAASTGNLSPTTLPMNQMTMQMSRYQAYPGLMFGAGAGAGAAPFLGVPGLQANIANNYGGFPTDPNLSLGYGVGLGAYPGNPQAGFMYGNPQLGAGYAPQAGLDNFATLNNIVNMANAQGLGAAPSGLYPQQAAVGLGLGPGGFSAGGFGAGGFGAGGFGAGVGMPIPGYFGGVAADASGSIMERLHNHATVY